MMPASHILNYYFTTYFRGADWMEWLTKLNLLPPLGQLAFKEVIQGLPGMCLLLFPQGENILPSFFQE